MPARRKSRSSPRRSLRRSKSRSKSPRRRSSGKARRAAVTRRSPKRRTYKGTRLYGATVSTRRESKRKSLKDRVDVTTAFAESISTNASKEYVEALAIILNPHMTDKDALLLGSFLSANPKVAKQLSDEEADEPLELPTFTPQEANEALMLIDTDDDVTRKLVEWLMAQQVVAEVGADHVDVAPFLETSPLDRRHTG